METISSPDARRGAAGGWLWWVVALEAAIAGLDAAHVGVIGASFAAFALVLGGFWLLTRAASRRVQLIVVLCVVPVCLVLAAGIVGPRRAAAVRATSGAFAGNGAGTGVVDTEASQAAEYLRTVATAAAACRVSSGQVLSCYINASPARCKQASINMVGNPAAYRRTWAVCVMSCAAAGFWSRTFGDCRR